MRNKSLVILVLLLVTTVLVLGCACRPGNAAMKQAETDMAQIWGVDDSKLDTTYYRMLDTTSESHRMMAIMILSGAGRDTNFDNYGAVYLMDIVEKDGNKTARVVVVENKDGSRETIIPQTVRDQ